MKPGDHIILKKRINRSNIWDKQANSCLEKNIPCTIVFISGNSMRVAINPIVGEDSWLYYPGYWRIYSDSENFLNQLYEKGYD